MSNVLPAPRQRRPTLRGLSAELRALRERVDDLEDARDLKKAIRKDNGKRLIPWDQAAKELGLE